MKFVKTLKSGNKEIKDLKELREILKGHGVDLAYLFGSHAKGTIHKFSDLDIAILFDPEAEKRMEALRLDLANLLGEEAIDLIDLEKAPPRLKYNVVKEGTILLGEDISARFEAKAMQEYFDFKPLEEIYFEGMKKRIESGEFGRRKQNKGKAGKP